MFVSGLLLHVLGDMVTVKNIRFVLQFLVKQAKRFAESTENDLDDKVIEKLEEALSKYDEEV